MAGMLSKYLKALFLIISLSFLYLLFKEAGLENILKIVKSNQLFGQSLHVRVGEISTLNDSREILIGISINKLSRIEDFTAKILFQYHNISSNQVRILHSKSEDKIVKNTIEEYYGNGVKTFPFPSDSNQFNDIFKYFSTSNYELLFLIDGDTIFLKHWKSFIFTNINKTDGVLSLYHSSVMHNYTFDCEIINGGLCVEHFNNVYSGIVLTKSVVETFLSKKSNETLKNLDFPDQLKEMGLRYFYPPKSLVMNIGQKNQSRDNNYCGVNEVPYRFNRCKFPDWIKDGIEFYFDRCTNPDEHFSPQNSIKDINKDKRFWVRPVISYSFYGNNPRYTKTAEENVARVFSIYPGWKIWIYTDYSVPSDVMNKLCEFDVRFIDMKGTKYITKMSWRFLVASEPVKMFAVRDIDSWLIPRGKAAADEWLKSGRMFHTIRDNKYHSSHPMNGGMWGGRYNAVPNMRELLDGRKMSNAYLQDMNFLREVIWPIANKSVWAHDSHSLHIFGEDHPFPTEQENEDDFVGRIVRPN